MLRWVSFRTRVGDNGGRIREWEDGGSNDPLYSGVDSIGWRRKFKQMSVGL